MQETEKIWFNGELVDWADAKIHVGAHALHYGSGVFEGIRCYETATGPAVFRLTDHLKRLYNSAKLLHMELPYSVEELRGVVEPFETDWPSAICAQLPSTATGSSASIPEGTPLTSRS
jgi:branched-subunit amino acid aminotransferase/4-amino-4-deoxychorismate lyase